jgi:hypothetical protein
VHGTSGQERPGQPRGQRGSAPQQGFHARLGRPAGEDHRNCLAFREIATPVCRQLAVGVLGHDAEGLLAQGRERRWLIARALGKPGRRAPP